MCNKCHETVLQQTEIRDADIERMNYDLMKWECAIGNCCRFTHVRDYGAGSIMYWPNSKDGWVDVYWHFYMCAEHYREYKKHEAAGTLDSFLPTTIKEVIFIKECTPQVKSTENMNIDPLNYTAAEIVQQAEADPNFKSHEDITVKVGDIVYRVPIYCFPDLLWDMPDDFFPCSRYEWADHPIYFTSIEMLH